MAVVRKIPCEVLAVTDHGERVYTVELRPAAIKPRAVRIDGCWPAKNGRSDVRFIPEIGRQ